MNHGHLLIHQRRFDRPKMGHVCVASHSTSDSETGSPLECTSLALWISYLRIEFDSQQPWMLLYSPINYAISMHKTWRSHASVGIMAHEEPRTDLDSHEAVCLQARSVRPLPITQDAFMQGAMSDATLSAWRAGAHEIQLSARRRQSCRSSGCFQAWSMPRNGLRAGPTPSHRCGDRSCVPSQAGQTTPRGVATGTPAFCELSWRASLR